MISRFRLRAGIYTSGLLLFVGLSLAAQGTAAAVTRAEMESFVYTVIGAAGIVVFGAFWVLLQHLNGQGEKRLDRIEEAIGRITDLMKSHHEDPLSHPAGSASRIDPLNEKLDEFRVTQLEMDHKLTKLVAEHDAIRGTEDQVCAVLAELRRRDPLDSPHQKRRDDTNGVDHRPQRGRS